MKIFRNGKGKLSVVLQRVCQLSYLFDIRLCTLSILFMRLYSVIAEVTKILLTLLCLTCLHPHTHGYCSICRGTEVTGCTLYIATQLPYRCLRFWTRPVQTSGWWENFEIELFFQTNGERISVCVLHCCLIVSCFDQTLKAKRP